MNALVIILSFIALLAHGLPNPIASDHANIRLNSSESLLSTRDTISEEELTAWNHPDITFPPIPAGQSIGEFFRVFSTGPGDFVGRLSNKQKDTVVTLVSQSGPIVMRISAAKMSSIYGPGGVIDTNDGYISSLPWTRRVQMIRYTKPFQDLVRALIIGDGCTGGLLYNFFDSVYVQGIKAYPFTTSFIWTPGEDTTIGNEVYHYSPVAEALRDHIAQDAWIPATIEVFPEPGTDPVSSSYGMVWRRMRMSNSLITAVWLSTQQVFREEQGL